MHRQQQLVVLAPRVRVLRDDMHAQVRKLGDGAPLLGLLTPKTARVLGNDHLELTRACRREERLVTRPLRCAA